MQLQCSEAPGAAAAGTTNPTLGTAHPSQQTHQHSKSGVVFTLLRSQGQGRGLQGGADPHSSPSPTLRPI